MELQYKLITNEWPQFYFESVYYSYSKDLYTLAYKIRYKITHYQITLINKNSTHYLISTVWPVKQTALGLMLIHGTFLDLKVKVH